MNASTFVTLGVLMIDAFLIAGVVLIFVAMIKGGEDRP
jgi:hypothetical protein